MIKQWLKARRDKRTERIGHWVDTGIADHNMGVSPQGGPYAIGTSAYIWWICGWTIAWKGAV
jgi:hypothetical protein